MKAGILGPDSSHPVYPHLVAWADRNGAELEQDPCALSGGDFLFLVSYPHKLTADHRARYRHCLVLHASNLPEGRGWSPHVHAIIEGADTLTVSLATATDTIDAGPVWQQRAIALDGTELHDEINARLFEAELALMDWALANCDSETPTEQAGTPTHYPRRTPDDSRLDPYRTLADQFDKLRVADPIRYPAHFEHRGATYRLTIHRDPMDAGMIAGNVWA